MSKSLVAYFSASGITENVAEKLADAAGADLFEIKPKEPYTKADLDWTDKQSRSTLEMNDRTCRPPILENIQGMEKYETVFIGFPVWWYREPSIIDTFMESYDFTGKTIAVFCTSGGSGIGDSPKNIQELAKGAKVLGGKRFFSSVSKNELNSWAKELIN